MMCHVPDVQSGKEVYFGFSGDGFTVAVNGGPAYPLNNQIPEGEMHGTGGTRQWILSVLQEVSKNGVHLLLKLHGDYSMDVVLVETGESYDFDSLSSRAYEMSGFQKIYGPSRVAKYVLHVARYASSIHDDLLKASLPDCVSVLAIRIFTNLHENVSMIEMHSNGRTYQCSTCIRDELEEYVESLF